MNKENLRKMAEYIRTVPQEDFNMAYFRRENADLVNVECNSVGCVIGHCTHLDAINVIKKYIRIDRTIRFSAWAADFTGLPVYSDGFRWCFDSEWIVSDNTPEGAARRIEWLIDKGLPENWQEQMELEAQLCYY